MVLGGLIGVDAADCIDVSGEECCGVLESWHLWWLHLRIENHCMCSNNHNDYKNEKKNTLATL